MAEIICPKLTINGVETNEYNGQTIKQIHYNNNTYVLQTTPTYDPILENNTWEQIKTACEAGDTILATWLGQTKSTTYNGVATSFRLVDTYVGRYKFYDNSDSHAVFEMVDATSNTFNYNSSKGAYSYFEADIKTTYDNTNYNYLATDLKSILKNTTVKSIKSGNGSKTVYNATNCKIFPASYVEMLGENSNYNNETNGGQFEYYVGKTGNDRIKNEVGTSNAARYHLRTPRISTDTYLGYCSIDISVSGNSNYAGLDYIKNGSVCFAL